MNWSSTCIEIFIFLASLFHKHQGVPEKAPYGNHLSIYLFIHIMLSNSNRSLSLIPINAVDFAADKFPH